ncbi:alpha/beta fold hydrolase [Ferviditalea candida]|uniref:Alpha/beta fold hydrolase n=1 Tax=Ferviditalea candida TaxID=3108399 RepID=A0ABU5ZJH6_9BACL|nr:alpha/beta fold hydrolase [Paenibacillaceae bacterium T2]
MFKNLYFETNYILCKNTPLFYRIWKPDQPKGLILLIHGAGEDSGHYSLIGMESLKHNIALMAPDLRGFGQSGGQRGHVYKFHEYLQDLHEIVVDIRRKYSPLPIFLAGYSLGGLVIIRYLQLFSFKPSGVILSSPAVAVRRKLPYFFRKTTEAASILAPRLTLNSLKNNRLIQKFKWFTKMPDWMVEGMKDPLVLHYTPRWLMELLRNGTRALKEASKFHLPSIFLYDVHDPIVDSEKIQLFFETIPTDDKANIVFSQGHHQFLDNRQALEKIFQWMSVRI